MPTILQNHYVLAVQNVRESSRFFVEMLGFEVVSEPTGWVFVSKDNCMIMLGGCPDEMPVIQTGCHSYFAYFRVDDADAYYTRLESAGAQLIGSIANKPWGMREFGVKTPDGHRIMIGQVITD